MKRSVRTLLVICLLLGLLPLTTGAVSADRRTYAGGRFMLEIDGVNAGWIDSFSGGGISAEVVETPTQGSAITKKHIAGVKYEDITVTVGEGTSKPLYEWIKSSFDGKYTRKNGAIIAADYNYRELYRVEFTGALITEVGMPALDAASKDAAKMTIKFKPEYTRRMVKHELTHVVQQKQTQKKWLPANFRLRIDGLDDAAARVNKIEAITMKQKVTENAVGEERDYQKEPGKLEFPSLKFTLADADSQPFLDYFEDFVIRGNNGDEKEKTGSLEYLATDGSVIFTLGFQGLGVYRMAPTGDLDGDGDLDLTVEWYVERVYVSRGSE